MALGVSSQVSTRNVTLVVPFLPHSDQAKLFPNGQVKRRVREAPVP